MKLEEYQHNGYAWFKFEQLYTGYDYGELDFGLYILAQTDCGRVDLLFEKLISLQSLSSESSVYGCRLKELDIEEQILYRFFSKGSVSEPMDNDGIEILTRQAINTYYYIKGKGLTIRDRQNHQYTSDWYEEQFQQFLL